MAGMDAGAGASGRKHRVYGCSDEEATAELLGWYRKMQTAAGKVWAVNQRGHLERRTRQLELRTLLVLDLCVRPPVERRVSPGQIARDAGVSDSTVFTILARELEKHTERQP